MVSAARCVLRLTAAILTVQNGAGECYRASEAAPDLPRPNEGRPDDSQLER